MKRKVYCTIICLMMGIITKAQDTPYETPTMGVEFMEHLWSEHQRKPHQATSTGYGE